MSTYDLLTHEPDVQREDLPEELSGVLCRCTGYRNIIDAVAEVARVFRDIRLLARCLPGADLTDELGDDWYSGGAGISLGPVRLAFNGIAQVLEQSDVRLQMNAQLTGDNLVLQMLSDPRTGDTDRDFLFDGEELGAGTDPRFQDADGDEVLDGEEMRENTDPSEADSDGDGRSDRYELDRIDDGLDPMFAEEVKTKLDYINDFACGFIAGEFNTLWPGCDDSVAWLAGDIVSGVAVVGDIRDILGAAIKGDVVSVGISLVSLVPAYGDTLNAGVKISKFLTRISGRSILRSATIAAAASAGDDASGQVFKLLKGADGATETAIDALRRWDPDLLSDLQRNLGDDVIDALVTSGINPRHLRDIFTQAAIDPNGVDGFFRDWRIGEDLLQDTYGDRRTFYPLVDGGQRTRFADSYNTDGRAAHESKVGRQVNSKRLRDELDKDCAILRDDRIPVDTVVWHFFPSRTNSGFQRFGPNASLLQELLRRVNSGDCPGFSMVVHAPNGLPDIERGH